METSVKLMVILGTISGLSHGAGVLPDNLIAVVGETVTFTTTVTPPATPFLVVVWGFSDINGAHSNIITSSNEDLIGPGYTDRVTLFRDTGSLELRNLTLSDNGEYGVTIIPNGGTTQRGNCRLLIHAPVSNVVATASSTDLVEFNSSAHLSCSASGSSLSFLWLNGSSEVTGSDRVQLADGGANLTILSVTRYDQGPFRCHVFNPINNGTSDPVNLSISYGPENTDLKLFPSQEYYEEGSDIILSCSAVSKPPALFHWFLNGDRLSDTGPKLRLMNIQMSQSGSYSCQAVNNKTLRYQTSQPAAITVLAPVSNVTVNTSNTEILESSSSSVRLSCSASGSSLSFLWLNGSSEVTGIDRVQLADGGANLTIVHVTRYDKGPFKCQVSNPVSNGTSEPINFNISYGPDNVNLQKSPSQDYYVEGSNITLTCLAVSRPPAQFTLLLNGGLQSDTGPQFNLTTIQESESGNYSCQAFNSKTLRYESSSPAVISVLKRISGASITSSTKLPIESNSVNLTCDAAGSVLTRKWMKDGKDLITTDEIILYDNNRVLSFNSLNKLDSGEYSCTLSNPFSNEKAKYFMDVIYGPENVQIKHPSEIFVNENLTLTCSAESTPSAIYTWKVNGTVKIHNSTVFSKPNIQLSDGGIYTCEAMNDITKKTSSADYELSVKALSDKKSGCSGGCIAGIVIAVLVVLAAAGGGGYYFYRKRKRMNTTTADRTGGEGQENTAFSGSPELDYADIQFFQNKDGGIVQLGSQNETSEYAEVRVNNSGQGPSSPPTYDDHLQRQKSLAPQPDAASAEVYSQVSKK